MSGTCPSSRLDFDRGTLAETAPEPERDPEASDDDQPGEQTLATTTAGGDPAATITTIASGSQAPGRHLTPEEIADMQDRCLLDGDGDPELPEGWNPDDWNDHLDHLRALQRDVQGWEVERGDRFEGLLLEDATEDVNYFEEEMSKAQHAYRKVTNKKGKRLDALSSAVDSDDFVFRRVLSGKALVPNKPRVGKTWIKQLFGFGTGLSLLCVLAGMAVASCYEAGGPFNSKVRRQIHNDFQVEDPCVTIAYLPLTFGTPPPYSRAALRPRDTHDDHDKFVPRGMFCLCARALGATSKVPRTKRFSR